MKANMMITTIRYGTPTIKSKERYLLYSHFSRELVLKPDLALLKEQLYEK